MNKWERRDEKLEQRGKSKFRQSDDVYESHKAKASAKKIARLKRRWMQEMQELSEAEVTG